MSRSGHFLGKHFLEKPDLFLGIVDVNGIQFDALQDDAIIISKADLPTDIEAGLSFPCSEKRSPGDSSFPSPMLVEPWGFLASWCLGRFNNSINS